MPVDRPTALELLEAIQEFLQERAIPKLSGHAAFEARVAANLLSIARREIEEGPRLLEGETADLERLLGRKGTLEDLETELLALIREGDPGSRWDDLIALLRRSAEGRLRITNPKYLEDP
jgi:hypothetical protein